MNMNKQKILRAVNLGKVDYDAEPIVLINGQQQ